MSVPGIHPKPQPSSGPRTHRAPRRACLLSALLLLTALASPAKGPEPPLRLPLEPMGFQPLASAALAAAGTLSTVHFIDDQHLLVTFGVRRLMQRLPDDPADDEDRTIDAVLVHIPTGKVLARTHWRVHDSGQYLWALGHGRFLLRLRNTLTTFAPLHNLAAGDPFVEQPFLRAERRIAAVLISPDRDLVTVETLERPTPATLDNPAPKPVSKRAQINFYRVLEPEEHAAEPGEPPQHPDRVIVQAAGGAVSDALVGLSLTSAGYIEVLQESPTRWLFDFDAYTGKWIELSPFDTSCRPHPIFVSASEFVSFGCRGSADKLALGGFNLRGEQMWQQNFMDSQAFPNFVFAPAAGRFALSRNIVSPGAGITADFAPSAFTSQELRVYQTHNGKQLLQVQVAPIQRTGQNYDLSPDGLRLAILQGPSIEIYRLPALTPADEAALHAARILQPEDAHATVNLVSHVKPTGKPANANSVARVPDVSPDLPPTTAPASATAVTPAPASTNAATPSPTPNGKPTPATATVPVADLPAPDPNGQPTQEPRKPPTLYTLPTDKPAQQPQ